MPEAVKAACRHRPSQKQAGDTACLGRQLRAPRQPHPVIGRLADPVIFDDHSGKPLGAQNVLKRGEACPRTWRIHDQQPPRVQPQRGEPRRIEHSGPAGRRGRAPDDGGRLVRLRQNPAKQRHRESGQRPVMPRPAAQHVDAAKGKPAGKGRIE